MSIRSLDKLVWGWERWQQEQIAEVGSDAGAALYQAQVALDSLEALRARVAEQQEQIAQLGVLTGVLVKLLSDAGGLDPKVLHYRVEAELEALAEAKAAAVASRAAPAGPQVRCVRCDRLVARPATQVTPEGATCDACMASGL